MMRSYVLVALLVGGSTASAQAPADPPPNRALRTYLLVEAQKHFAARSAAVAALKTPDDIKKRQDDLRAKLIAALGGLPEKTPLKPVVVGTVTCDGYRIERVIYESRPEHHVTANLYLPTGNGPFPGVLLPIGHSNPGKAADYMQRAAILLARNGIASLAYDPIGQGERRQLLDPAGKPAAGGSTNEHTLIGVGAMLLGEGTATYRVWDGIRSLDYLASRPEIDAKRLGCTGCSGGGTLTSYLMALDERIVAAAPSCYLTTLERLFATIGPQDAEQNIPGQVALGIDHADYVFLRAPRPTLILAASRDFFDISGTWTTFREAKRVYTQLGLPERVEIIESDSGHGYPKSHREAMARWMARWLLGKDIVITEPDFPIQKEAALLCTRTGQVLEDLKGRSCFDLNRLGAERLEAARATKPLSKDELTAQVRRYLALPATIAPARLETTPARPGRHRVYTTEPGVRVSLLHFEPEKPKAGPLVVLVDPLGKYAVEDEAERRRKAGERVVAIDLRGFGATAPAKPAAKPSTFGTDYTEAWLGIHLNRPLLGQRTLDLLAVLAALAQTTPEGFQLIGYGNGGPIVLHAAALDANVKSVEVVASILSWADVARTPLTVDQLTNVVPGVLRAYDLPALATLIAPRPLTLRGPVDPTGTPLPAATLEKGWPGAQRAYRDAPERLRIVAKE